MSLTTEEIRRYARHLSLPQFGEEAQEKLKAAKVLVVGTGGLGAPILQYLTAAGVGTIGVVDFDTVDESNLQRQVLFGVSNVREKKTTSAISKLQDQNPNVRFEEHADILNSANAMDIVSNYDVVVDGTDNFPTRYLVNDACVLLGKPYVYASIYQFEGQVSVFNYQDGPNYRDLFPTPPPPGLVPSCAEGGVLGVLPGIIGSLQASEALKVIAGIGKPLSGKLFLFDALDFSTRTLNVRKDPANPISGDNPTLTELIDYDEFCGINSDPKLASITVQQLKEWQDSGEEFVLIDVREGYEYESANLGGIHIPLGQVEQHLDKIPKVGRVVVHCKAGGRSAQAIGKLEGSGYQNLTNLEGGILAWKEAFEPDMEVV